VAEHHESLTAEPASRWGLGDVVLGLVLAYGLSIFVSLVVAIVTGPIDEDELSLGAFALLQIPLWAGFAGATVYAARRKGSGSLATEFGLRMERVDIPVGVACGIVTQLVLIPLLYLPLLRLLDENSESVEREARKLTDRADDPLGVIILVIVVVVIAPIIEELFYRGLLMRSLEHRFGPGWALVGSSVVFGAAHFQPLQLIALIVFGLVAGTLAQRTGRLGPSIFAHMGFNGITVLALLL
jgi:uncharacterized protein